jgi:hypothetical protein
MEETVIHRELILDGTGINYRPIKTILINENLVTSKEFRYVFGADSPEWSAVLSIIEKQEETEDLPTFREWEISNHPVTGDERKVHLVNLTVTKDEIKALFMVENIDSLVPNKLVLRVGHNGNTFPWEGGTEIGERDYWEFLTVNMGMTPYELLDFRVPGIDMEGGFDG